MNTGTAARREKVAPLPAQRGVGANPTIGDHFTPTMAKQNRRINIAKREAAELRAKVAKEERRANSWMNECAELRAVQMPPVAPDLVTIVERLRAIFWHSFLLPTAKSTMLRSEHDRPSLLPVMPSIVRHFCELADSPRTHRREMISMVHFVLEYISAERSFDLCRHIHLRMIGPRHGQASVAISEQALAMMQDPKIAERWVAQEFGHQIAAAVREGKI
jgi:hypothetical protein